MCSNEAGWMEWMHADGWMDEHILDTHASIHVCMYECIDGYLHACMFVCHWLDGCMEMDTCM